MNDIIKAVIQGIIEGLTEFLPISSTGHLLLSDLAMGHLGGEKFSKMFVVFIQIGAIAAVVVYFRKRIAALLGLTRPAATDPAAELESRILARGAAAKPTDAPAPVASGSRRHVLLMLLLASLPLVLAAVGEKWAEKHLWTSDRIEAIAIATALILGGVIMIAIEYLRPAPVTDRIEAMTWKQAIAIGMAQVIAAVFPGTSRSGATIMAGLLGRMSRPAAAEFSFFLAIPAMCGACSYKLLKFVLDARKGDHPPLGSHEILLLAIGTVVSFVVAWAVIAWLMYFIRRYSFVPFGVYRIVVGVVVLVWILAGSARPSQANPPAAAPPATQPATLPAGQ